MTRRVKRGRRNIYDRTRARLNCGNVGAMAKAAIPRNCDGRPGERLMFSQMMAKDILHATNMLNLLQTLWSVQKLSDKDPVTLKRYLSTRR
jgi:hypothetical protein